MSFERGGRADKYGNRYEDRYLAKLLLRLVREEFASITVEPLGINKDSVEYVAEQKDGTFNHYQCKGTNGNFPSWRFCDLKKHNVFSRAKEIIEAGGKNAYYHSMLCFRPTIRWLSGRQRRYSLPDCRLYR